MVGRSSSERKTGHGRGAMPVSNAIKSHVIVGALLSTMALTGCVSQSKYDALRAQNEQLQQQTAAQATQIANDKAQISRLQGAIKYTVNSDLLFASGGRQMSARGKQLIANLAGNRADAAEQDPGERL